MIPNAFTSPHEFTKQNSSQNIPIDKLLDYRHQHLNILVSILPNCSLRYDVLYVPLIVQSHGLIGKLINQKIGKSQIFMLIKLYEVLGLCSKVGYDWKETIVKPGVTWESLNMHPDVKFLVDWKYCNGSAGFPGRCFMQNIRSYIDEVPF